MKRRKLVFGLFTVLLSLLLTLICVEVLFRIIDFPFKESWVPSETALARFDSELGWSYIPKTDSIQKFGNDNREIRMCFDSIGARAATANRVLDTAKPTILFVGGSYTMGHGVLYEESTPGTLDSLLGGEFQIINLGTQGYGTDQSLIMLKRYIAEFNVKAVVYIFIPSHVKRNANYDRRFLYRNARFIGTKPLFWIDRNGALVLKRSPMLLQDASYSRIGALLRLVFSKYTTTPAFDLTKRLVFAMKESAESNGAHLIIVNWSSEGTTVNYGKKIFASQELDVIDLTENPPEKWPYWVIKGDGHPTKKAHAYVAELLREKLRELPKPDSVSDPTQTKGEMKLLQ